MPIQRPSQREHRPSALDVFTGREVLIAVFEGNLEHKKPEVNRVLVFYGDGGIGKTTLLQKLEQLHRHRCPQALIARLDLAGTDTTPPDLLLYRLRRRFPTVPFPCFSLALAEYGRRFHPEQVYGNDRNELLEGAGPYAEVLDAGLKALEQLTGVALAVNAMKAAAMARRQLSDWVLGRAEPLLQRSQSYSEEQLLAQLPLHWARDFRQALSSHLGQDWDDAITSSQDWDDTINYSGPPPLIALDTYETLWHAGMGRSGRRRETRERWLVDLVSELPEVLWVIGGRDRLSWEEGYDRGWSEACEQHLVGQLSEEDARSFLAKRGIEEPEIVEKILRQAAGVPFYLELETQLYDKTPAEERRPELFGGSHQELIDRLLTHLDASERATLKLMAAFGIWDQELFQQAVAHFATGYPATDAAELGKFWSIEPIGEGRWQLHNEMAHHLQAYERSQNNPQYCEVHRWGFEYFDRPLKELEAKAIQAVDAERLGLAQRHAQAYQSAADWIPWFVKRLEILIEGKIWMPLLSVVERCLQDAQRDLVGNDQAIADLLTGHASILQVLARFNEAEPQFRKVLSIYEASHGKDHPKVATALIDLASLLQDKNRLAEAEPLYRRALAINEASYGPDHPMVAINLNNLALLLHLTNHPAEAEPLYLRALGINETTYGPDHREVAICLHNLARLLQDTNRLAEADPLYRRALSINEAGYGADHPNVALNLSYLAELLRDKNLLAEAEPLSRRALAIDEATFGPEHPKVATRRNSLASLLHDLGWLEEAEQLYRRALDIDEASYGPDHPEVAIDLSNLAQLLQDTSRLEEAESLYRRALEIDEASYGPDHPEVAIDLSNLAQLLEATSRLEEAESLYRRALEIDEASYGPDHPEVAIDLSNLAQLLEATSRLEEAESMYSKVVRHCHKCLGLDHPYTQEAKANLIRVLQAQGLPDADIQAKLQIL